MHRSFSSAVSPREKLGMNMGIWPARPSLAIVLSGALLTIARGRP